MELQALGFLVGQRGNSLGETLSLHAECLALYKSNRQFF